MGSHLQQNGILRIDDAISPNLVRDLCRLKLKPSPKYANTWTESLLGTAPRHYQYIVDSYYGQPSKLRNTALLQFIEPTEDTERDMLNANWHVDHLHQVSMMLLLSEVTNETMHMEYAIGSHRGLKLEGYYDDEEIRSRFRILKVIGPPGTLYIFDTAGVHRANYLPSTSRKILHLNFTTGHDMGTEERA